ncbi:MAG TPA: NirA family protein, partial [Candidatus Eisenbacteria bacterium]|nr:NirA family protein [Candidatus Eisenbacteria bacterium]
EPSPGAGDQPETPDAIHRRAQDRFLAEGKKLSPEEEAKRARNPLDRWDEIEGHAREGKFPRGTDVFSWKFHGLFHVAPAQDAFMCRLRLPNGILSAHQLRGVADIAERFGGGYADITTRANLQVREIGAGDSVAVLTTLHDLGILPRGAGADNIRNVTGSPTAGIDPREVIDTRPLARELHHHILHHRELYGLPRKFNIAFDGGGAVGVLEDTNDIGFAAVRVGEGKELPPGVYFRVEVGGITGHGDFARDTGLCIEPRECVPLAAAMVRVFIEHGDRTDRRKARLKYLVDRWGLERYVAEAAARLPFPLRKLPRDDCEPRGPIRKHGHLGIH